jgi:FAD/FMN-containing dehydrogenase
MNCTIGGMIGNNSCGATAQRTGKVVDNIAALEVLLYDGTRFWCGPTDDEEYSAIERRGDRRSEIYRRLRRLAAEQTDEIRARYPDIPRRVSGYNLDSLLPEQGFDVAGLLVGSESTLVTVLRAKLKLVPVLRERSLAPTPRRRSTLPGSDCSTRCTTPSTSQPSSSWTSRASRTSYGRPGKPAWARPRTFPASRTHSRAGRTPQ